MTTTALRPRSITEIVDASFQIYRAHFGQLVLCAAIAYLPTILLQLVLISGGTSPKDPTSAGFVTYMLLGSVAGLLSYALMSAVITICGAQAYLGEPVDVGAAVRRSAPRIAAVIVATLLVYLAIGVGLLLFIVPAFYLIARFFAVTPALILEDRGITDAISRSGELSKGRKVHILLTYLLMFLIYMVAFIGMTMLSAFIPSVMLQTVVTAILTVILYPLMVLVVLLLYYDARVQSEGLDIELMAGSLDPLATPAHG